MVMIVKKINLIRKAVFLSLTKNITTKSEETPKSKLDNCCVKRILVVRPNHRLGNLLLVSALIQELENSFPNASISLLSKGGLAEIIYKNYSSIKEIHQLPKHPFKHPVKYLKIYFHIKNTQYDLAINAAANSSSGRIFTNISQAKVKIMDAVSDENLAEENDSCHIAKQQIHQLRNYTV